MATLTSKRRGELPKSAFAIPEKAPGSGSYPIHDESHARSALSMVAKHGSDEDKRRVRAAVARRYPHIGGSQEALQEAPQAASDGKPKGERDCKMPHEAMSRRGKSKCPGCGANIGKVAKTEEAETSIDHPTVTAFHAERRRFERTQPPARARQLARRRILETYGQGAARHLDAALEEADGPKKKLGNKPGKTNWVEKAGGLPNYIKRIAEHLKGKHPEWQDGRCIAIAVNAVKKMCASGDVNFPGKQNVNAGSRAEACAAVASWEAKKKAGSVAEAVAVMEGHDDRLVPAGLTLAEVAALA